MSGEATELEGIAQRALEYVRPGQILGLGTGRAATAFVRALGDRVKEGLEIQGVPTSDTTASLARELRIPLLTLAQAGRIDTTFDGADEVSPSLELIKGYGGALVREKIVAASSERLVILVGEEKLVDSLGARGRLPVEVVPFGLALAEDRLRELGYPPTLRHSGGEVLVTDNHNYILDCAIRSLTSPAQTEAGILSIPGVVGTGIFVGMAQTVLVQQGDGVREMIRTATS